jgi:MOSC domain-containing protein YiiM
MGRNGHDNRAWVRRFAERSRPGAYLRVLQPGALAAGDPIEVVHRPGHGVTVSYLFRAVTREPHLLPGLLVVEGLVTQAREKALRYRSAAAVN